MPRLNIGNIIPGVVVEIGPDVQITFGVDTRGRNYLAIDAPREFEIKRVAPGTTHNGAARVCPRCMSALQTGKKRCGACGKDMGGQS